MKNYLLILITIIISTQISAQVKTGGGPEVPEPGKDVDPIDRHIDNFMDHLIAKSIDPKCDATGERKLSDRNLIQVYLKLSIKKNAKDSSAECDETAKFLTCINDEESQKYAWRLERMMGIEKHLSKKYNIPKDEAKKILKFFSELDKKAE